MLRTALRRPAALTAALQRCPPALSSQALKTTLSHPKAGPSPRRMASNTIPSAGAAADANPPPPPPTFSLLSYTYVPDILEKRGPYRAEHIDGAKAAVAAGKMVMAGATGDPVGGALFIWAPGVGTAEIEAFAAGDPYVKAGLVPAWKVEPYMVVAQGGK